jgi:tetratricopeptide (TPR) repeat protein
MPSSDGRNTRSYDRDASSDPDGHLERALSLEEDEEFEAAIAEYSSLIATDPDYSFAYYHRGYCLVRTGDLQRAINDFSEIIRIDPDDSTARFDRAVTFYDLEEYTEALDDLKKVLEANSEDAIAHYLRGNIFAITGDLDRAVRCFEAALIFDPDYEAARANRITAYRECKTWWIFDRRGCYLGNISNHERHGHTAQITKDPSMGNPDYDEMISVYGNMGKERIDNRNSVIFTEVDLEEAVDAAARWDLLLSEYQEGPEQELVDWFDSLKSRV